ncbi:MAG: PKD domain-containing protein [Magnetococcus sp. WYHC-3]
MNRALPVVLLGLLLVLPACSRKSGGPLPGSATNFTINGTVADGPFAGAGVSLVDPATGLAPAGLGNLSAITDANGRYGLVGRTNDSWASRPVLVEVNATGAYDIGADGALDPASDRPAFPLSAVVNLAVGGNVTGHVSPLTCLAGERLRNQPALNMTALNATVVSLTGITLERLQRDPTSSAVAARGASVLGTYARVGAAFASAGNDFTQGFCAALGRGTEPLFSLEGGTLVLDSAAMAGVMLNATAQLNATERLVIPDLARAIGETAEVLAAEAALLTADGVDAANRTRSRVALEAGMSNLLDAMSQVMVDSGANATNATSRVRSTLRLARRALARTYTDNERRVLALALAAFAEKMVTTITTAPIENFNNTQELSQLVAANGVSDGQLEVALDLFDTMLDDPTSPLAAAVSSDNDTTMNMVVYGVGRAGAILVDATVGEGQNGTSVDMTGLRQRFEASASIINATVSSGFVEAVDNQLQTSSSISSAGQVRRGLEAAAGTAAENIMACVETIAELMGIPGQHAAIASALTGTSTEVTASNCREIGVRAGLLLAEQLVSRQSTQVEQLLGDGNGKTLAIESVRLTAGLNSTLAAFNLTSQSLANDTTLMDDLLNSTRASVNSTLSSASDNLTGRQEVITQSGNETVVDTNHPPVAVASADVVDPVLGQTVHLSGANSSDSDGQLTAYQWSVILAPSGSNTSIADAQQANASFTVEKAGRHILELTVWDNSSSLETGFNSTILRMDVQVPHLTGSSEQHLLLTSGMESLEESSDGNNTNLGGAGWSWFPGYTIASENYTERSGHQPSAATP